jgi:GMP synthase-like glutamine amidotransferase
VVQVQLLVIQQQSDAPAGLLGEWAVDRGWTVTTLDAPRIKAWPDPGAFDAVAALGSDRSVHASSDAWIAAEIAFLRRAHDARVPVLGICFGAQALAAALGGRVARSPVVEIGWYELAGRSPELPLGGEWFEWHEDGLEAPPQASTLGRTSAGIQGFTLDLSVGVQFHPEVTPEIVERWLEGGRGQLAEHRIDGDEVLTRTRAHATRARTRAMSLFDAIAASWEARR